MKYKIGDKVRIQSKEWYESHKNKFGKVWTVCLSGEGTVCFDQDNAKYCGKVLTIAAIEPENYAMVGNSYAWTEEMIEGLAEDGNNHLTEVVVDAVRESNDRYRIVVDPRFDIEVDEGEYYAVRRKREYPKSFGECCKVLGTYSYNQSIVGYKNELFSALQKLLICRDAYWKIAGEEMGLGKPWEPDWKDGTTHKFVIHTIKDKIYCGVSLVKNQTFSFPTPEMRDAFKVNFDPDIEFCKELL